jgi:hypothetical protein
MNVGPSSETSTTLSLMKTPLQRHRYVCMCNFFYSMNPIYPELFPA